MNENEKKLDWYTISVIVKKISANIADSLDWLVRTGENQTDEDFDAIIDTAQRDFYFAVDLIRTLHNK